MRVQYLFLTALFPEGITEPLGVSRRHLYAFKVAESKRTRLRAQIGYRLGLDVSFSCAVFGFPFAAMPARHRSIPKRYWTCACDGVMLSHTTEEIRARIPFGAAHRLNFDDVLEFVAHHKDNRSYKSKGEIVREGMHEIDDCF
jgi:hypothetical protein